MGVLRCLAENLISGALLGPAIAALTDPHTVNTGLVALLGEPEPLPASPRDQEEVEGTEEAEVGELEEEELEGEREAAWDQLERAAEWAASLGNWRCRLSDSHLLSDTWPALHLQVDPTHFTPSPPLQVSLPDSGRSWSVCRPAAQLPALLTALQPEFGWIGRLPLPARHSDRAATQIQGSTNTSGHQAISNIILLHFSSFMDVG